MSQYEVILPPKPAPPVARFYTGDETGALYWKMLGVGNRYLCLIPGQRGPEAGSIETAGGFTPVQPGALLRITV